jgi:hypothetical protein
VGGLVISRTFVIAVLIAESVSCTSDDVAPSASPVSHAPPASEAAACAVTLPDESHRAGDPAELGDQGYGNGSLWAGLWPNGHIRATEDNVNRHGEIVMKIPWDRGVRGRLEVTGRRLDADAHPLRADFSDYGLTGFQPPTLIFPTAGCWEVTGTAGNTASRS